MTLNSDVKIEEKLTRGLKNDMMLKSDAKF